MRLLREEPSRDPRTLSFTERTRSRTDDARDRGEFLPFNVRNRSRDASLLSVYLYTAVVHVHCEKLISRSDKYSEEVLLRSAAALIQRVGVHRILLQYLHSSLIPLYYLRIIIIFIFILSQYWFFIDWSNSSYYKTLIIHVLDNQSEGELDYSCSWW